MNNPENNPISRRTFVLSALALAALGAGPGRRAEAQVTDPRPPTVDTSDPKEVADGVWVVRDHRIWLVPNVGIIVGKDAALVIDCGLGPANGERVLELARKIAGPKRRLFLTVTHFHPEHGYGAQAFRPEATIVYNRAQRDELQEKGIRYVDLFRRTQSKAAAEALEGTKLVMPHFVYDGPSAVMDLGGRTVEMHTWGLAHTRGDQVVFLPKEKILFAGDLIEERMFPIFPWFPPKDTEVDGIRWANVLHDFRRFHPRLIVPGHGDPGDINIALSLASHIKDTARQVRTLRKAGASPREVLAQCKPRITAAHADWEHSSLIDLEIEYFSALPS